MSFLSNAEETGIEATSENIETAKMDFQRLLAHTNRSWSCFHPVVISMLVSGLTARYTGRPIARLENTFIGGIYSGFSAYRDPASNWVSQAGVAAIQGLTWGMTDTYLPQLFGWLAGLVGIKYDVGAGSIACAPVEDFLPEPAEPVLTDPAAAVANPEGAGWYA
jgi:hypothetical protein